MAGGNGDCGVAGVSVYRRGGRWAYAISAGSDVVTGERNRICRGGLATDDQAWRAALAARAGVPGVAGGGRTVDQFLSEWLETVERCVKPSVVANYRTNIDAYVRPAFGARRLWGTRPDTATGGPDHERPHQWICPGMRGMRRCETATVEHSAVPMKHRETRRHTADDHGSHPIGYHWLL